MSATCSTPGDLVLSLGAGNIHEQLSLLAADLVIAEKLKEIVGEEGDVRLYEPLAKHTTLRVGGPAQFWVEPRNEKAFGELIRFCRRENLPLFVIGRGSNLLVRDGGIRGVVVHPSGGDFEKIEVHGNEITAGVGAKLKQIAYAGKAAGLGGLEWMEGIPGAVGGGLRMNAGAMGVQTFDQVVRVRYLDREGSRARKNPRNWKCTTGTFRRSRKTLPSRRFFAGSIVGGRNREPAGRIAGKTPHHPAEREERRLHFQESRSCPAGKLVDELGLKDLPRRRRARLGGARKFYRE